MIPQRDEFLVNIGRMHAKSLHLRHEGKNEMADSILDEAHSLIKSVYRHKPYPKFIQKMLNGN